MSDDLTIPKCEYCHDDSGRCNDPVLDEDTYFSLTLRSGFKNHTVCNFNDTFFLFKHA